MVLPIPGDVMFGLNVAVTLAVVALVLMVRARKVAAIEKMTAYSGYAAIIAAAGLVVHSYGSLLVPFPDLLIYNTVGHSLLLVGALIFAWVAWQVDEKTKEFGFG